MMATPSLTTTPSGVDQPGDGTSPGQAPEPSSLLSLRDTIEECAEQFTVFRVPGAAQRLRFPVSDRRPRIGEESDPRAAQPRAARSIGVVARTCRRPRMVRPASGRRRRHTGYRARPGRCGAVSTTGRRFRYLRTRAPTMPGMARWPHVRDAGRTGYT